MRRPFAHRGSRGFTLLEVLVALAILSVGIASVLRLMGSSARAATRTQAMTRALFVAEELMEELSTLNESQLQARSGESGDFADHERRAMSRRERGPSALEALPEPGRYAYAVQVAQDPNEPGLYRVNLDVTWPESGGTRIELTTLRRFAQLGAALEPQQGAQE
jgi:type II secretion system protein I